MATIKEIGASEDTLNHQWFGGVVSDIESADRCFMVVRVSAFDHVTIMISKAKAIAIVKLALVTRAMSRNDNFISIDKKSNEVYIGV